MTPFAAPLAVHEFIWGHSPSDLFLMGGPVMWPLLLCSVVALAIIVERTIVLGRSARVPEALAEEAARAVEDGRRDEARASLQERGGASGRVLARQLELADWERPARAEAVQRAGGLVIERLERRLSALLLVAQASPLLGLLGTVSGLVGSFWKLETINGPVEPSDLAAGIWAALLTTVFGLLVGIPASAAWHLLQDRADAFARRLGFAVTRIEEALATADAPTGGARARAAGTSAPGRAAGAKTAS